MLKKIHWCNGIFVFFRNFSVATLLTLIEHEFKEFLAGFYGATIEAAQYKKWGCLTFGHFLPVSRIQGQLGAYKEGGGVARRRRISLADGKKNVFFHIFFVTMMKEPSFGHFEDWKRSHVQSSRIFIPEKGPLVRVSGTTRPKILKAWTLNI